MRIGIIAAIFFLIIGILFVICSFTVNISNRDVLKNIKTEAKYSIIYVKGYFKWLISLYFTLGLIFIVTGCCLNI
jgi:hypothetical protein